MIGNAKDVRKSPEWREVENWYNRINIQAGFSIIGDTPVTPQPPEEMDRELEKLLRGCPRYYPGWFHRGWVMLRRGSTEEGERLIDRAFDALTEVTYGEEEFAGVISQWVELLEKMLHYDLIVKCLEKSIRVFPEIPQLYDELAFYSLQLPGFDKFKILSCQHKALELDPGNDYFTNNLGWIHLLTGDTREAQKYFQQAMNFNVDNETALSNLETAEYMERHGMTYRRYLLRPVDRAELDELKQDKDFEELSRLTGLYNDDRLEAFKLSHLEQKSLSLQEIQTCLHWLRLFLQPEEAAVDRVDVVYDDIDWFRRNAKNCLVQFLETFEYVEEQDLDDVLEALSQFYRFLEEEKMVTRSQYETFYREYRELFKRVAPRLEDYFERRHDVTLNDEERIRVIGKLFR